MKNETEYDIRNLYPIQAKSHPTSSDNDSLSSSDQISYKPGHKVKFSDHQRRPSPAQQTGKRRMSIFPISTVSGPNGRRVSAFVDYNFYNHRMSVINTLISRTEEKTKLEEALKEAQQAAKKVRIQGLREFVHAGTIITKIFWFVLFVLCTSILIYEIKSSVDNYYGSPISTKFTIWTPGAIKFPDVYICFAQNLNRSYIRQHPEAVKGINKLYESVVGGDKRRRKRSIMQDLTLPWDRTDQNDMESILESLQDEDKIDSEDHDRWGRSVESENHENHTTLEQWNNDGEIAYDFLLKAGFKVGESFLKCTFRGYSSRTYNCSQIVRPVMDPNYFTCYVVSVPKEEQQVMPNKGLRLLINSQVSLYPLNTTTDTEPNKYAGLFVSVTDRFDPTNWYKGVVRTGTLTKLSLSATNVQLLNVGSGQLQQPCVDEDGIQYHIFNTSYSRTACQMDCLVYAFYRHCNCIFKMDKSLVRSDILAKAPFCAFAHTKSCLIPNVTNSKDILAKVTQCRQRCHSPCNSTRYDIRGSSSMLNPSAFPTKSPMQDLIQLEISFGRMEITELVQSYSKTVAQMIADMGGNVNLWLGASVITLLEIPIFLVIYACYRGFDKMTDMCC